MKTNNLLYFISLFILIGSIFLVVEYQNSGRIQLIAGLLTMIGLAMNIIGFAMKKR
jgi:membrane-bound ClpP family serine protease